MISYTSWDAQIQTFDIFNRSHSYDNAFVCKRKRIKKTEMVQAEKVQKVTTKERLTVGVKLQVMELEL
jgi:hypothetical protein